MNKIDLNGRTAVVTGGAQGFGRAITERFVSSGAKVAIWDHDLPFAEKTAKEIGSGVTAFKVDVSDLAAVEKTRDATLAALGKIDILVNNAGIAGINKTVWETDLDEWRKVLRINLDGPFICCKAIAPAMIAQGYGRIVNIASIAGKEGNPNAAHYSASKAGLIALTKSLGKELAQHDILVNAVTPDDAAAYRLHAGEDPERTFRAGGRTGGDGGVAGVGRLRVLHRRGVRHFRRPCDVLVKRCSRQSRCRLQTPTCRGRDPDADENRHDAADEIPTEWLVEQCSADQ
jgi:3-oxoacyl-[acyl-carrier protein] reductase